MSTKIKNSLLGGIFFSCITTIIWLLFSSRGKGLAISLLVAAAVSFLLYLLFALMCRKGSRLIKIISEVVLETVVVLIFLSVSVSGIAALMMFHPHFDEESYNKLIMEENAEELTISKDGQALSGWVIPGAEENVPIVLYFGGNGENSSTRILRNLSTNKERKPFEKCNFICFDYPGYGKSSGSPSEASFKQYGTIVYDWAKKAYPDSPIIVMGFSIGTGVANYVASQRDVDGMILMAPYADGYDLYNNQMGIFYGPLRLLVTYKMEAAKFAEEIAVCPLVFATPEDTMVPYESSRRLMEQYPNGSEFVTIEGITHNDFWSSDEVLQKLAHYIEEIAK